MEKKIGYWEKIFQNSDFGDERRNIRAMKIANTIENSFERSASAALPDHASLKAASLFVNSASITPHKIAEHFIRENMEAVTCNHVLIAEDTTEMNFSWRKKKLEGLGPVGNDIDQGFFLHPGIMIDPNQEGVLGLAGIKLWIREEERVANNYKSKPIEEKESYRWLSLPEEARGKLPENIHMTVVTDREGDIFDFFHLHHAGGLGKNTDLLIRASRDRKLEGEEELFFKTVDKLPVKGSYELKVNGTKKRTARTATLEVRYDTIAMSVPKTHSKKKYKPVPNVYVIDVKEIAHPEEETPIHWTLLTTWKTN
ncbi:MAG: IS4 family transposase, partial [bacterium]|nr:IS4 family transposase [bacterium]